MTLNPLDFVYIVLGLAGLFFGGEWLVKGASRLAVALKISPLVIGLTIVAYGTSMPEMLVSVQAALAGNADISTGNIVGSNIANIGLILGVAALIWPMTVHGQFLTRELPIMIGVSIALLLLSLDGQISQVEGILLFSGAIGFTVLSYVLARREGSELVAEVAEFEEKEGISTPPIRIPIELGRALLGTVILVVASNWLVVGASNVARAFGVSELAIGITLVAVGTSLPELATSLVAALRKESEIAIGNVVGSNIFNILGILGVTAALKPININPQLIQVDMFVMIGMAVLLLVLVLNRKLSRWQGGLLLALYVGFVIWSFAPRPAAQALLMLP